MAPSSDAKLAGLFGASIRGRGSTSTNHLNSPSFCCCPTLACTPTGYQEYVPLWRFVWACILPPARRFHRQGSPRLCVPAVQVSTDSNKLRTCGFKHLRLSCAPLVLLPQALTPLYSSTATATRWLISWFMLMTSCSQPYRQYFCSKSSSTLEASSQGPRLTPLFPMDTSSSILD